VGDEAVPAPRTNSAWDLLLLQTAALCRDAATGQHALPGIRRFLETFSLPTASILTWRGAMRSR